MEPAENENQFSTWLTTARQGKGWSQERLSEETDGELTQGYISSLERSARSPSRKAILAIANALGLSDDQRDEGLIAGGYLPIGKSYKVTKFRPNVDEMLKDIAAQSGQPLNDAALRRIKRSIRAELEDEAAARGVELELPDDF